LLAEQIFGGHLDVGERQLGGVLGIQADLVRCRPDAKIEFSAVTDIIRPFLLVQVIAVGMLFFSYLLFGFSLLLILCFRDSERTRAVAEPVAPVETPAEVSVA
jgi:hypothetical protein